MALVKVSVENVDTNEKTLYEIDMKKSLEANIADICNYFSKPYSENVFGLKIISTNDGKTVHTHISADNFSEIKDGYFLKLVYSLHHYCTRIFDHIKDDYKEQSFQDLYDLSVDPEFIKEIVKNNKHLVIMDIFTNSNLTDIEATACLIAVVHLIQKHYITDINQKFLDKVISIIKTNKHSELIKFALSILHKILYNRETSFTKWKEEIIKTITVNDIMTIIKNHNSELQYGALLVINTLIKSCKGEKRQQLIKEIDKRIYKEAINEKIIAKGNVDKNTAKELYIYQTNLLSLLAETLNTQVPETEFLRNEFEPMDSEIKKMTLLMDFDETNTRNKAISLDNLLEQDDVRISLASMSSRYSEDSRFSSRIASILGYDGPEHETIKPSLLTIEALRHYKKHHYKNFYQSQVEEAIYEPGILESSERVVQMLAKILHIGTEPDRTSTCYQPTIFTCSSKTPFFFELFSRTMWLLSKTRREMKASTMLDYNKVIYVLTKQVRLVLDEKPIDLKKLTEKFAKISYNTVMEIWQKEKEEEMKFIIQNNPSVLTLKEQYSKKNEEIIFKQRLNYITKGTLFPKFNDKKINGNFFAKLANDGRNLLINDYEASTRASGEVKSYPLAEVTHIVEGKACPHVKNNSVKDPSVAFSILLNNELWINFKAADKKMAGYWLDALNLLLNKDNRSSYYKNELDQLVEMDLYLHLIELQNIPLPKKAPPIPRLPFEIKPTIPPKPQIYESRKIK